MSPVKVQYHDGVSNVDAALMVEDMRDESWESDDQNDVVSV